MCNFLLKKAWLIFSYGLSSHLLTSLENLFVVIAYYFKYLSVGLVLWPYYIMSYYGVSVTYLVSVPISMFCPGTSSTVSYGDLCFIILEVRHIFLQFYNMWRGKGICDNIFSVMLLVWCFCNKRFVIDYVLCDFVCIVFLRLFLHVEIILFVSLYFWIMAFLLVIFVLVVPIFSSFILFQPYFLTCLGLFQKLIFWVFAPSLFHKYFPCARVSRKSCKYPCIITLRKGIFSYYLEFIVPDCLFIWSNST